MLAETEPSDHVEDRRTPDDLKYEKLYDQFQKTSDMSPNKLTDSELSWLKSQHVLRGLRIEREIDDYNESRGFKVKRERKPRPQD